MAVLATTGKVVWGDSGQIMLAGFIKAGSDGSVGHH